VVWVGRGHFEHAVFSFLGTPGIEKDQTEQLIFAAKLLDNVYYARDLDDELVDESIRFAHKLLTWIGLDRGGPLAVRYYKNGKASFRIKNLQQLQTMIWAVEKSIRLACGLFDDCVSIYDPKNRIDEKLRFAMADVLRVVKVTVGLTVHGAANESLIESKLRFKNEAMRYLRECLSNHRKELKCGKD
jgi:hypothetical protein